MRASILKTIRSRRRSGGAMLPPGARIAGTGGRIDLRRPLARTFRADKAPRNGGNPRRSPTSIEQKGRIFVSRRKNRKAGEQGWLDASNVLLPPPRHWSGQRAGDVARIRRAGPSHPEAGAELLARREGQPRRDPDRRGGLFLPARSGTQGGAAFHPHRRLGLRRDHQAAAAGRRRCRAAWAAPSQARRGTAGAGNPRARLESFRPACAGRVAAAPLWRRVGGPSAHQRQARLKSPRARSAASEDHRRRRPRCLRRRHRSHRGSMGHTRPSGGA